MTLVQNFINESAVSALGWTLIHSVWQIALIGIILKISLVIFRNKTAEFRYLLSVISLSAIILLSVFTFIKIYFTDQSTATESLLLQDGLNLSDNIQFQIISNPGKQSEITDPSWLKPETLFHFINTNIQFIVLAWFLGIGFFSLKFAGNFWYISRLKKQQTLPVSGKLIQLVLVIGNKLNLKKKIRVLESALIKVPMVIGYLKPVILLPVGLATSLPIDQIEAILAHEMAHIRRNDYLINLLKSLTEVVFFYHPAIWWISSMLETEREHCCDDTAIRICGNEKSLQTALLNLQEYEQNTIALAPALFNNNYKLLNRIMRMKTTNQFKHGIKGSLAGFVIIISGLIILATSTAFSPNLRDLPGDYAFENPGFIASNPQPANYLNAKVSIEQFQLGTEEQTSLTLTVSRPDTTVSKAQSGDEKVTIELDGNYNLISVMKDGKSLEGDEKKEYEAMAAKMKKLNEQEKQQEDQKAALEKAEKELQAAQEQIEKAQQEYEKAMAAYHGSYYFSDNSATSNVFVWTEGGSGNPKTVREIKIEKFPEHPDIPEIYALKLSEKELSEAFEEGMIEMEYEIQMDQLENEMKIIEIEKEINDQKGENKVIVKTSGTDDLIPTLRSELAKDGILKAKDANMSFSLSQDQLEVNGKKLSEDLHKKYLKIYKQSTGKKLEGKFKIEIKD